MENEDAITFSQSDFLSSSFVAFEDMRKRGHLCDLTIKAQNRSFSAHRVILTAGIPSFDSVFSGLETSDKQFAIGENLDPKALESLICFAYTGKVTISAENVLSLLGAAQFLQLTEVQNACLTFLSKKLNSGNAVKVSTLACALNNSEVMLSSNAYIQDNFEKFAKREEFLSLPFARVKEIVSGDDLNVSSEEIVFEALIQWVKASPSERQVLLPDLLSEIRLTYLSVTYLMERVESEELLMSSKDCRDLVKEVKYYHMMPDMAPAVSNMAPAVSNMKKHPRNCLKKDLYALCVCPTCGSSVHRYDSTKAKWFILSSTETSCCPSNYKHWNNTVAVNGELYIFRDESVGVFKLNTHDWKFLWVNQEAMEGAALVPYENMIYCFGSKKLNLMNRMLCFDTQKKRAMKKEDMPTNRQYAAGTVLGKSVYITGGGCNHVGKYTPSTDQWCEVSPMLLQRSQHCCMSLNEKIYVCGNEGAHVQRVEVYDPRTDQWNFLPFLDSKSTYISLVSDHDKIYAFTEKSGEIYEPRTRQWKSFCVPGGLMNVVSVPTNAIKKRLLLDVK